MVKMENLIHCICHSSYQTVLDVSSCLSLNSSFQNVAEALRAAMATINQARLWEHFMVLGCVALYLVDCVCGQNKELFNSASYSAAILADVRCILCSPKSRDCHVTRALADLHKLLGAALSELKDTSGVPHPSLAAHTHMGGVWAGNFTLSGWN